MKKILLIILPFLIFQFAKAQTPTVTISDQNANVGSATVDCIYNFVPPQKIRLTADFPLLESTTAYTSSLSSYNLIGNLTDGTPVSINADDVWSSTIPIGFTFCFYGNSYTNFNVSDNGIVRFGYNPATPEGSFSSIVNTTPSASLIRNAIFGGFQDYIVAPVGFGCTTNCGTISYYTIGTAPFRKTVINFNGLNYFNCTGLDARKAYFQIILSETTNEIDVNVQDKPLPCLGNSSANGNGNSLIGLNNANGTIGIAAPGRNTSEFAVTNESYKFMPSGASATTVVWTNQFGVSLGNSNPIEVIPPQSNTFYTATVTYNTCIPRTIQGTFTIAYDPVFPVSTPIVENICDVAAPFPNQIYDVEALVTPSAGQTITFYNSQLEADNDINALSNMNAYNLTLATTTLFYRRSIGTCYSTSTVTVNLFQTPDLNDVTINYCDIGNDNVENNIYLQGLTSQIPGFNGGWMTAAFFQNLANATANINPINFVNITNPPGFYDIYVRINNISRVQCFDIISIRLQLLPNIELNVPTVACITDTNFNFQEVFDLTSIAITASTGPANPADLTFSYYNSLYNATYQINPVLNPNSYNLSIPQGQTNTTLYVVANAAGYCFGIVPVTLTFCIAAGGDGGGGGGGAGGFGGLGACLEIGDAIPTFDLNVVFSNVMTAIPVSPIPATIGFYTTLLGAQTQDNTVELSSADVLAFTPVAPFSEIWVRFIDSNGIIGIKRIIVPLKFKKHEVRDFDICDVFDDSNEFIDLQNSPFPVSYLQQIENENPGETVTAYASMADYLLNSNPITTVTLSNPLTTIYVKVTSYGCDSDYTLNFNLNPFDIKTPIINTVCDIDSDGTEVFDLLTLLPTINTTGYITPSITLHNTLNDAYAAINPIANPTAFSVTASTTIFVRIEESAVVALGTPIVCPAIQEYQFGFFNSVNVNAIGTQEYCDLDNDNQVVLGNLNALIASIVIVDPSQPVLTKLYTSLVAAQTNDATNEILPDWDLFTYDTTILGTTGTIYLQLTNSVTNCTRIVPIVIEIKSLPLTVNQLVNYCDFENDNNESISDFQVFNSQIITINSVLYNFNYFASLADAVAGTPELPIGTNIQDGMTVYVSIQSGLTSGCSNVLPIEINFNASPIVTNIAPIVCDNLGNGSETVNLFNYQNQLVVATAGLTFRYYSSLSNLQNNLNAFSNFFTSNHNAVFNASNNAPVIYVKVIDNVTQCFSIATISIQRHDLIDAYNTTQFSCDISTTNQLQAIFNLPASIPRTGLDGMIVNPTDYTISFHISNANAVNNTAPIINTTNYLVVANQTTTIFVRFQDNITGCFTVKILELQIYNLPKFVNSVYAICDYNLDGNYVFDLNELNGTVVEITTPFTFEYFNSEADGLAGINPITTITNYTIPIADFPKTIYVKGTNSNNCSKVKAVIVGLKPNIPMLSQAVSLLECDADNNGTATFNLTNATVLLTNETGVNFTYFTSLTDLQNNTNAIATPTSYQNISPNIIYVRLTKDVNYCDTYGTITLIPFYEEYTFPALTTFCDNNADGTEIINLATTVYGFLNSYSPTTISLEFYNSNADAVAGIDSISNVYTFTNFSTPIFVKIINIATNCAIIKPLNYNFYSPIVLTPFSTKICDIDRNDSEIINVSNYFNALNATFSNYIITSYLSQNGAENEVASEIISNTNYNQITANQTYWIRFQDSAGCYSVSSIAIEIVPYPNPQTNPIKIELCDANGTNDLTEIFNLTQNENHIRNGNSTWTITYHTSQNDAETGSNIIINPNAFSSITTSVWIRVVTTPVSSLTTCAVVVEQEIEVIPLPIPNTNPPKIVLCDDNLTGDLQEIFNITQNITYVRNGDNSAIVSYHATQNEAQNGLNPIANPTTYLSGITSVWIRLQSDVATTLQNCAVVVEQEIEIVPKPFNLVTTLPKLVKCDDVNTGNLTESFDLSTNQNLLLNGNTNYQVSYHTSIANAQDGGNPIANLTTFETGNTSVFIRIIVLPATTLNTCAVVVEQKIEVIPLPNPNTNPTKIVLCDENLTGDLQEIFNITQNITYVRNGDNSALVSYHATQNEAQNGLNPIANPTTYLSGTTSVWIRLQSNVATTLQNCAVVVEQEIEIVPKPFNLITTLPKLVKCDDVNTGNLTESFDLSTNQNLLLNGNTNYQVSYHTSLTNAQDGSNPIANFTTFETGNSTVFARIIVLPATALSSCAILVPQETQVNPLPQITPVSPYYSCIINASGQALFNLSTKKAEILNGQNPTNFLVTYHLTESEAKQRLNPLPLSYLSTSATIWASIYRTATTCVATVPVLLVAENAAFAIQPNNITICDEDGVNDGFHSFDFRVLIPTLLGTQNGNPNISVAFYESMSLLNSNQPISNISNYMNTSRSQTIYVKVVDQSTLNKCMATTSFELEVNLLPEPTPQDGFLCTDPVTNQLLGSYIIDSGLNSSLYSFEWYANTTLLPNETSNTLEVVQAGNYFVVATNLQTNCESEPTGSVVSTSQPALATVTVEYSFQDNIKIIVNAVGSGNYVYQLDNNNVQNTNVFENVLAGTHQIIVYDTNGCNPITVEAIVLDYSRFFTPNGDGVNDTWHIKGIAGQPEAKVYLFDRYGKFIKQLIPGGEGWDGKYNGQDLPSTDYWFTVFYKENGENKEFRSHFSMKR